MASIQLTIDTQEYWQAFASFENPVPTVWHEYFAAPMRDGQTLRLPLRDYGATAMAGMIVNQASFLVVDRLAAWMADDVAHLNAEVVVGLPTLGHTAGAAVARALGHLNWVAPSTTRKRWYSDGLAVPTRSITSPQSGRTMYLDPRLLPRLRDRRVLLIDDVICTGASASAGLELLARAGIVPVGVAVAMAQSDDWRIGWNDALPLIAAFTTPVFDRVDGGWAARPPCETAPRR